MADKIREELENEGMTELFEKIEMPLVPVLAEMEVNGILCDIEALKKYADELSVKMNELTEKIYALAGETFNIGSPKQLGEILFVKMGLKGGKKTKTGYSTDADTLEKLRKDAPIVEHILEYRKYAKLKSTYCVRFVSFSQFSGSMNERMSNRSTRSSIFSTSSKPSQQRCSHSLWLMYSYRLPKTSPIRLISGNRASAQSYFSGSSLRPTIFSALSL